ASRQASAEPGAIAARSRAALRSISARRSVVCSEAWKRSITTATAKAASSSPATGSTIRENMPLIAGSRASRRLEAGCEIGGGGKGALGLARRHGDGGAQIGDAAPARRREQHRRHLDVTWRLGDAEEVVIAEGDVVAKELAACLGDGTADR